MRREVGGGAVLLDEGQVFYNLVLRRDNPLVPATVVLSIAAGIRLADLARWLLGHERLVRAIPNTPALVGKGISGAFAASSVDAAGRALVSSVLAAAGEQLWVNDEGMLDAEAAMTGSRPTVRRTTSLRTAFMVLNSAGEAESLVFSIG